MVIGGGTGGTRAANRLRRVLDAGDEIVVIDADDRHLYQPVCSSCLSAANIDRFLAAVAEIASGQLSPRRLPAGPHHRRLLARRRHRRLGQHRACRRRTLRPRLAVTLGRLRTPGPRSESSPPHWSRPESLRAGDRRHRAIPMGVCKIPPWVYRKRCLLLRPQAQRRVLVQPTRRRVPAIIRVLSLGSAGGPGRISDRCCWRGSPS